MNQTDAEILELNALCSALVDRSLDAAGRARLHALLADSEEARRFYVRAMALSASLHDYAGEMQSDEPEPIAPLQRIVRMPAWRWAIGSLAAAAVVVLAFWIGHEEKRAAREVAATGAEEEAFVATLSAATDCRWTGAGPELGDELQQGQQLNLAAGLAEVTFNSGAQLVLEGPATLDLSSAWEAVLRRGSLRANVPPEAIGFRVSNPDVEVTDLGTEFSMVTSEGGGTEVFVLKGSVEASAGGRVQRITLREQQARRFDRSSITEVRDREQKLKKWAGKSKFKQFAKAAEYVHWSFDDATGGNLRAETIGWTTTGDFDGRTLTAATAAGHRASALALERNTSASAKLPPAGAAGTTVAFWVCLPEDAALNEAGPMLALRRHAAAEISWNRDPTQGALGALRTDTERGRLIGATSLRDGRWHHIAVVLGPNGRGHQYVDGRLEGAATKQRFKLHHAERNARTAALAGDREDALTIGHATSGDAGDCFRGLLDELFIANRALTPPEIRQLLRENKPAQPSALAGSVTAEL